MTSRFLVAVSATIASAAPAIGQVSIISGFDTPSNWTVVFLNNPATATNILSSGGNPGGYADLRPVLNNNTLGGAGYYQTSLFFTLGGATTLTDITLSADYRWFSGPTLTLVPFLIQQNRLYKPASSIALGSSTAWTGLGPVTFPISEFSNSTGIALHPAAPTQVGFMAVIQSPSPIAATARVGIDNINLQVIPSPGALPAFLAALSFAAHRRRR